MLRRPFTTTSTSTLPGLSGRRRHHTKCGRIGCSRAACYGYSRWHGAASPVAAIHSNDCRGPAQDGVLHRQLQWMAASASPLHCKSVYRSLRPSPPRGLRSSGDRLWTRVTAAAIVPGLVHVCYAPEEVIWDAMARSARERLAAQQPEWASNAVCNIGDSVQCEVERSVTRMWPVGFAERIPPSCKGATPFPLKGAAARCAPCHRFARVCNSMLLLRNCARFARSSYCCSNCGVCVCVRVCVSVCLCLVCRVDRVCLCCVSLCAMCAEPRPHLSGVAAVANLSVSLGWWLCQRKFSPSTTSP